MNDARFACLPSGVKLTGIRPGYAQVTYEGETVGEVRVMPDEPLLWESLVDGRWVAQGCWSRTQAVSDLIDWLRS